MIGQYVRPAMAKVGTRIDESGTLLGEGGLLLFRRELGGRWHIDGFPRGRLSRVHPGRLIVTVVAGKHHSSPG